MNPGDFPAPKEGFVITHVLVVADQDRSREFCRSLLDGQVLLDGDPVIIKVANTWLTLVTAGGPTDDKPGVTLSTPADPSRSSGFINVRVADISRFYNESLAKGAKFLTEPEDHGREIRAYLRDPDGHLIEVGQVTGLLPADTVAEPTVMDRVTAGPAYPRYEQLALRLSFRSLRTRRQWVRPRTRWARCTAAAASPWP
jgi:catechol 2,3-dioxygenase-like lactoylglutathione lyase family enzyme